MVTDEQRALQWADWCKGLPQGIPEMYKLHQRWTQQQVRSEEKQESSDDDGHEADDEDTQILMQHSPIIRSFSGPPKFSQNKGLF